MNSEEESNKPKIMNLLESGATVAILFQLLIIFLSYNISAEIITLGFGWILLVPGYTILFLAAPPNLDDNKNVERLKCSIHKSIKHPYHLGWSIISIAMTCIAQSLISLILTVVFISFLALVVREDSIDSGT